MNEKIASPANTILVPNSIKAISERTPLLTTFIIPSKRLPKEETASDVNALQKESMTAQSTIQSESITAATAIRSGSHNGAPRIISSFVIIIESPLI